MHWHLVNPQKVYPTFLLLIYFQDENKLSKAQHNMLKLFLKNHYCFLKMYWVLMRYIWQHWSGKLKKKNKTTASWLLRQNSIIHGILRLQFADMIHINWGYKKFFYASEIRPLCIKHVEELLTLFWLINSQLGSRICIRSLKMYYK